MPRFEQRDKDGKVTEVFVITEDKLKADPDALIRQIGPKGAKAAGAPEGYDLIASLDHDPDYFASDVSVHYFAKRGSYDKEKPSKLAGLMSVVPVAAEAVPSVKTEGLQK